MDLQVKKSTSIFSILITIIIVVISLSLLYFIYKFLYGSSTTQATQIIKSQVLANVAQTNLPAISPLYEGGDYAVSLWVYINSYNINRNTRKHILEIGGNNFSTLLIALGAFKNTLMVRTHSRDSDSVVVQSGSATAATGPTGSNAPAQPPVLQGFQNATPGSNDATRQDSSLTVADLNSLFSPLAMDDSLLNPTQICDIPSIDMQRWVNITVALNGNMIDVYMDGKLARSCVTPSYYKVDPIGVKMKVAERGGFDGYLNTVSTFNIPLSPADIYRIYEAGPSGTSSGVGNMVSSLFTGRK
jgi:hypothetical protein